MQILLIDIDSTIPNLALKKIEKYHKNQGHEVICDFPLSRYTADKIYVSCIFPENKSKCKEWEGIAEIGGTGYDIKKKLPPEINKVKPKINWGFTTRGCIRNCHFCFVPEKEGNIHKVGDIYDIWDGEAKELTIMDNNIFAMPNHFMEISKQLKNENLKVDFNQGLDHRLLTKTLAEEILSLKHIREIRFAFDHISYRKTVLKALKLLKEAGCRDWKTRWYVYIGENDTFQTVYKRMSILKEHKQTVYVMRDKKVYSNPMWQALSCWGNFIGGFKQDFKELLNRSNRMKQYKKLFKNIKL